MTTQVHLLQSQLDPKEIELQKLKERMQEISREYDISLQAITEKESVLNHKTENLMLLQKQVRELRNLLAQKDSSLRRAATFFDEFIYSMHEAKFKAKKKLPASLLKKEQKSNQEREKIGESKEEIEDNEQKKLQRLAISSIEHLSVAKAHDLVTTLDLDGGASNKLHRLHEILKPYLNDTKVEVLVMIIKILIRNCYLG